VKTMFGCVLRGCANAQDWEKRKQKMEKKKQKKKQKRERKKKKCTLTVSLIYQLHGTGSSMLAISCGLKGMVGCVPTTGCTQKLWGGLVSDACNVGASGRCRQDLMMAWQLDLLARQAWGHVRLVFGCMSRGCANAQDWEKKTKVKKTTKKKKVKSGLTGSNPHKNTNFYWSCMCRMCVWLQ